MFFASPRASAGCVVPDVSLTATHYLSCLTAGPHAASPLRPRPSGAVRPDLIVGRTRRRFDHSPGMMRRIKVRVTLVVVGGVRAIGLRGLGVVFPQMRPGGVRLLKQSAGTAECPMWSAPGVRAAGRKGDAVSEPFKGTINVDIRDSVPDWSPFEPSKAPDGAPNVVYIVLDDVGFSAMGAPVPDR